MEQYKKQLRTQNISSGIGALAMLTLSILSFTEIIEPVGGDNRWSGFWNGFIAGCTAAILVLCVVNIILNLRAMGDQERLKKMYVKTHDERKEQIWFRSGANAYWFDAFGLLVAGIIVGYFSPIGSVCIIGSLLYICVIRVILKLYYSKKM